MHASSPSTSPVSADDFPVEDDGLRRIHRRVKTKPFLQACSLAQTKAALGAGSARYLKQSFLFPIARGDAIHLSRVLTRRATIPADSHCWAKSGVLGDTAIGDSLARRRLPNRRRFSAYASWARPTDGSIDDKDSMMKIHPDDSPASPATSSTSLAFGSNVCSGLHRSPAVDRHAFSDRRRHQSQEEHEHRLLRERSEMLEAARRREAEQERRKQERNAWQVVVLAEHRRRAADHRKEILEMRRSDVEAQTKREEMEQKARRARQATRPYGQPSHDRSCSSASDLHGDVLLIVFSFLDARTLAYATMPVCSLWHSAAKDDGLWLPLCQQHWATKAPRFHLTQERQAMLLSEPYGPASWCHAYRTAELDGSREFMFPDELTQLTFQFRWRRRPAQLASASFCFESDGFTTGHPCQTRFPWRLDDLGVGLQWGPGEEMFPKGITCRLPDWTWRIENISGVLTEAGSLISAESLTLTEESITRIIGEASVSLALSTALEPALAASAFAG